MDNRSSAQQQKESLAPKTLKLIHQGRIISCYEETLTFPEEKKAFDVVKHPGAVAILAIDEKENLVLIKQWRRTVEEILIEIPAGTLEKGEDPYHCAQRELREETGFRANSLTLLGGFYTAPGFCNEYIHLFLAKDLIHDPLQAEDSDDIDLYLIPLQTAFSLSQQGKIKDCKTLSALFLYIQQQIKLKILL